MKGGMKRRRRRRRSIEGGDEEEIPKPHFGNPHFPPGAVLPVFRQIFEVVARSRYGTENGKKKTPRALRCKLEDGSTLVGLCLHQHDADMVKLALTT